MRKVLSCVFAAMLGILLCRGEITLEECLKAAEENYPTIKKYELVTITESIDLSDINRGWLPRLGVYGQTTIQNVVPSFPTTLSNMIQQTGNQLRGLGKLQYKVGVDVNQTVWDGGVSKSQRVLARSRSEVSRSALNVEMYAIRQRVESLYFGVLLIESQIKRTQVAATLYETNLNRIKSMVANGTAMQADADMVEAQLLGVNQQLTQAMSTAEAYRLMLSKFTGLDVAKELLILPEAEMPAELTPQRPEQEMFSKQMELNSAQCMAVNTTVRPKIGFFAQTYYGYPGIDYFKSMMERNLSFNFLAGVKISWNIDAFYTKKNALRKLKTDNQTIEADKETFLLNNSMQVVSQLGEIRGLEEVIKDDERILQLRQKVRVAAESQLKNGIIDPVALTTKINEEVQASLNAAFHSIQLVQAVYNIKNTLNR